MRAAGFSPHRISRGNLRDMYWTFAQLLAHHTSNGCDLRPGDLLASGTISGPDPSARGCLLEITRGGADPIQLPNGEHRTFLEDGDQICLRAYCEHSSATPAPAAGSAALPATRIGFGRCTATLLPAK
jgi:fumarylacetoacetase